MEKIESQSSDTKSHLPVNLIQPGKNEPGSEHLEQMIQENPTAIIFTDKLGVQVRCNQSAVDILGVSPVNARPEEWPQRFGLYTPDGRSLYTSKNFPLMRALQGETIDAVEILRMNGDPSRAKWISMSAKPLLEADGKIAGAMVFLCDITSSKQIEHSLEKRIKLEEAAFNFQKQIIEIGNDPLRILYQVVAIAAQNIGDGCVASLLNVPKNRLKVLAFHHNKPGAYEILYKTIISHEYVFENTIEQVVRSGKPLLIPTIDQDRLLQDAQPDQMQYINKIGIQSVLVVPIIGRDRIVGTLSLIRDRGGSAYTQDDQIYMMDLAYRTGLAIDNNYLLSLVQAESSEKRSVLKALEQTEARFQSIFNSTTLGIKLLNSNGIVLETNPAFHNMIGYSEEELVGTPISALWHPDDKVTLEAVLEHQKLSDAQSDHLEHRLITKSGATIWVNVTFTRIKNHSYAHESDFIVAIAENITARKLIEAEMTIMKSRLQSHIELERLRLAQELHDGPLQDLYSAIFKLESWMKQADPSSRAKIISLKQDLSNVIQGLRSTAKDLRPPALGDFGLERAIRSYAEEFNDNHPELTIRLNLAHDGQILPEDVRLILFRLFQHSIANILRHAQATEVYVSFSFDAEEAQLAIADNGVGFIVPANWVDLVRQGHYGLAGAVERVSLLNGRFSVKSTPGEGTIVRAQIPIPENAESVAEKDCED